VTTDAPVRPTREDRLLEQLAALALIAPSAEFVRDVLTLRDDDPEGADESAVSLVEIPITAANA
jgi:hypothetical protein